MVIVGLDYYVVCVGSYGSRLEAILSVLKTNALFDEFHVLFELLLVLLNLEQEAEHQVDLLGVGDYCLTEYLGEGGPRIALIDLLLYILQIGALQLDRLALCQLT